MSDRKMSNFLRNTGAVAALVTTSALATGFLAPSASAMSIVPQQETEIDVGLGCLDATKCLSDLTPYWIKSIESQVDTTTGTKSRLFVDNLLTANTYGTSPFVKFKAAGDEGTTPVGFWYRPSEVDANGQGEEQGRLEVGTYKFTFTKIIPELTVTYFDTESNPTTGFLDTDGTLVSGVNLLPAGADGNTQYQILKNVSFITLKLGVDYASGTGDGVDFQLDKESVPEPGAAVGLGALGLMGIFGLRKRNKNA